MNIKFHFMKVFLGSNVKKSVINQLLTLITMLLINDISFSLFVLLAHVFTG